MRSDTRLTAVREQIISRLTGFPRSASMLSFLHSDSPVSAIATEFHAHVWRVRGCFPDVSPCGLSELLLTVTGVGLR